MTQKDKPTRSLRPVLRKEQASFFNRDEVLRYTGAAMSPVVDPWEPGTELLGSAHASDALIYHVDAAFGSETATQFRSVQRAINQAVQDAKHNLRHTRIYIEIAPGRYEGLVYVPHLVINGHTVGFTLCGTHADQSLTVLHANIDAEMSGVEYAAKFGDLFADAPEEVRDLYTKIAACSTITTANASVVRIEGDDFQAANFTIHNTYGANRPSGDVDVGKTRAAFQLSTGAHQAVALMIAGADKVHCENLHLKSFQDTLYLNAPKAFSTVRSYFKNCRIEGDVDFIFGQATAYFDVCTIISIGARAPHAWVVAPSTNLHTKYGFVFNDCDFTHDNSVGALAGTMSLGRQWFESVRATPYGTSPVDGFRCNMDDVSAFDTPVGTISRATLEAVGKCVILNSRIGAHINRCAPWDDWFGGNYTRSGVYEAADWNPRFRPAQFSVGDISLFIGPWLASQNVDLSAIDPATVLLAEFENQDV